MEKVIRKVSFKAAEQLDVEYWSGKTIQEKLEALTRLRMQFHGGKRLVKVILRVPQAGTRTVVDANKLTRNQMKK